MNEEMLEKTDTGHVPWAIIRIDKDYAATSISVSSVVDRFGNELEKREGAQQTVGQ